MLFRISLYIYTNNFSMHSIIFCYEDYKIWWYLCNQTDNFSNEPTLNSRLSKKNVSLLYNRHFVQISDVCVRYGGVRCNTQQQQKYFFSFFFSLYYIFSNQKCLSQQCTIIYHKRHSKNFHIVYKYICSRVKSSIVLQQLGSFSSCVYNNNNNI